MKPRELRSKSVGTKVSEAELRVLESRAERAGLTLSEWVRDVSRFERSGTQGLLR